MATATTNTPISHADDAGFRAWGSELSGMLADVGLVQTADTGQIDWDTVTKPGTNTAAGYEIWEWSDSLQDTAPVVMKIEYGTHATATMPGGWLTVGTGTDGAGTITGATVERTIIRPARYASGSAPGSGSYPSYASHTDGAFGLAFKCGGNSSNPIFGFVVSRPLDTSGALTSEGVAVVVFGYNSTANGAQSESVAFATSTQYGSWSRDVAMVPMGVTASVTGTDYQVIRNIAAFPRFRTLVGLFTYIDAEITQGTQVDVALDGSTARAYLCLGSFAPYAANQNQANYRHAMLWE